MKAKIVVYACWKEDVKNAESAIVAGDTEYDGVGRMKEMLNYIKDCLIIGMAAVWLYHFIQIAREGSFYICEPSKPILIAEIVFFAGVLCFGIWRLIKD